MFSFIFLSATLYLRNLFCFFIGPHQQFFLINICFSSSSAVYAKKKFWVVSHLLHMCVIFCKNFMLKQRTHSPPLVQSLPSRKILIPALIAKSEELNLLRREREREGIRTVNLNKGLTFNLHKHFTQIF